MTSDIARSPATIAEEINHIKSQTSAILGAAFSVARASCFEIGKRLEEAKSLVPHGSWGAWLAENVAYSESTANDLMRIYREFGDEQIDMLTGKSQRDIFEGLNQSQLVALFTLPPAERVPYVEEHREELMGGQSIRELKRQIEAYKAEALAEKERAERLAIDLNDCKDVASSEYNARHKVEEELLAARAEVEEMKSRPVEASVVVHQPSEEQIEQLRADIGAEYEAKLAAKDTALEAAKAEADKIREADKKKAEKLVAGYERKLEEAKAAAGESDARIDAIRADYEKRLRAANLQGNVRAARVSLYLSDVARLLGLICDELDGMESEEPGAGQRMRATLATKLDRVLTERGLTV